MVPDPVGGLGNGSVARIAQPLDSNVNQHFLYHQVSSHYMELRNMFSAVLSKI